eukprot:jgi/Undpi1/13678/HiC_scaffold_9.g03332.m1
MSSAVAVLSFAPPPAQVQAFHAVSSWSRVISVGTSWQAAGPACRHRSRTTSVLPRRVLGVVKEQSDLRMGGSDNAKLETDVSIEGTDERPAPPVAGNLFRTLTGPQFSVAVGIGIILAVLANRIATPNLVDTQARTDILGVIASGGLVTNGVYLLDLNVKEAEEVTLVGTFVQEYAEELSSPARQDLQWLGESLLLVSAATSVLVYRDGKTLARVGVMGESAVIKDAPILRKCFRDGLDGREQYLAALQTLPGKIEFDYLPENCQAVLMLPMHESSAVVVIGTNRARAFTPKDIAWMKGLSEHATLSLREAVVT